MNCPIGGYPTLWYNDLHDFTAETLSEVCTDVCIEPSLQPLSGETLDYATANVEDDARVDVCATGFWGSHRQMAYFDVKVFNPNASSYRGSQLSSLYRRFEQDKCRKYEQRIREVEMALSRAGVVLAIVSALSLLFNVTLTQFYTCMQAIYTNYNDKAYCT